MDVTWQHWANERPGALSRRQPWALQRGAGEGTCPSWNLQKMTSYAAFLWNSLKFSLALSALAINTLEFSLKHRKKHKNCAEKWSTFIGVGGFAPSGKFSAAPMTEADFTTNEIRTSQKVCYDVVAFSVQLETCDSVTHIVHDDQEPPWL